MENYIRLHEALVGSRLFKINEENSDFDYLIIIVLPINYYLGIDKHETHYHYQTKTIDTKFIELREWVSMATQNKPSSLDAIAQRSFGNFTIRDFLSQVFVKTHEELYRSEMRRLIQLSETTDNFRTSYLKNFTHTLLRLEQAETILKEEYVKTDFSHRKILFDDIKKGNVSVINMKNILQEFHDEFHDAYITNNLPLYPDRQRINQKLSKILLDNLTKTN